MKGVENFGVSGLVSGHMRYRYLADSILKKIGFEDVDMEEVAREEAELKAVEDQEKKKVEEKEKKKGKDANEEAEDMEKEVEKKNEESIMSWATEKLRISSGAFPKLASKAGDKEEGKSDPPEMNKVKAEA